MHRRFATAVPFAYLAYALPAQSTPLVDSVVTLAPAALRARSPAAAAPGTAAASWSAGEVAASGSRSAAELLDRAGVHVRAYGPGLLSSVSVRGGSAAQTLALWEGVPLLSPSLGQLDWSLLDLGGATAVALARGGGSAAWGSGAVSGTVSLDAEAPAAPGTSGAAEAYGGAFGERGARGRVAYGAGAWRARTEVSHHRADNDYPYLAAAGRLDTERRQANADQHLTTVRQSAFWRPGVRDALELHYWGLAGERGVAPTSVQARGTARQRDAAHRLTANWQHRGERGLLTARAAYLREGLDYRDELAGVDSESDFDVWLAEATAAAPLGRSGHTVSSGATYLHTAAAVGEVYAGGRPREERVGVFASHGYAGRRLSTRTSLRAERVDGRGAPLTAVAGLTYRAGERLTLRARASRDYRLPTFNDRYWRPGGTPDLRPEAGWSQEAGADLELGALRVSVTAFHRHVRDWILWARAPGDGFWSATNLAAVRSSGLEPRLRYRRRLGAVALEVGGGYDLVRSVSVRALEAPALAAGDQLWYVPRHAGFAHAHLRLPGGWRLGYRHRWRGASPGVNAEVPASAEADVRLSRCPSPAASRRCRLGGFVEVRNLTDARVELVERRVLPGRHLRVGLTLAVAGLEDRADLADPEPLNP